MKLIHYFCAQFDVKAILEGRLNAKNVHLCEEEDQSSDGDENPDSGLQILKTLSADGIVFGKERKRIIRILVQFLHFEHVR